MARLSRTQKYADLRDKISQDREETLYTEELSQYGDKLNNVQNKLQSNYTQPVYETRQTVENTRPAFEDIKKAEDDSLRSLDDILNSMMSDSGFSNVVPQTPATQRSVEQVRPVQPQPQEKPQVQTAAPTSIDDILASLTADNAFIDNTLKEVDNYNRSSGKATLNELSNNIVDEVRHPEVKPTTVDDEFSNTVSLEIDKVLNEIKAQQTASINVVHDEPVHHEVKPVVVDETVNNMASFDEVMNTGALNTPVKEVINKAPFVEQPAVKETFEHPVLTKTLEEPVVEIKNLNETINMTKNHDIVDDTIPFNVDKVNAEFDDEDEYEDEAPSKALNVILGILIFVLVAVLGVIVYYILVAKGIIG